MSCVREQRALPQQPRRITVVLADAITITALGIGMVFLGLILTSGLIVSFSWLNRLRSRRASPKAEPTTEPQTRSRERLAPEIVAVITAVLETERRLYHTEQGKLTITREPARAAGGVRRDGPREDPQ